MTASAGRAPTRRGFYSEPHSTTANTRLRSFLASAQNNGEEIVLNDKLSAYHKARMNALWKATEVKPGNHLQKTRPPELPKNSVETKFLSPKKSPIDPPALSLPAHPRFSLTQSSSSLLTSPASTFSFTPPTLDLPIPSTADPFVQGFAALNLNLGLNDLQNSTPTR